MAGGPSTPALVVAAARAGAMGYVAGGYKAPAALRDEVAQVRAAGVDVFGANLFVPGQATTGAARRGLEAYVASLQAEVAELAGRGVELELGRASWDDDDFDAKVEVLLDGPGPPPIVTFTFGCPARRVIDELQARGAMVGITVTTPDEVDRAVAGGADCLVVQGAEAGAHRGSFTNEVDDGPDADLSLADLLEAARSRCSLPLLAAGGIATPAHVAALAALPTGGGGPAQLVVGTAFLRSDESGAHRLYKDALGSDRFARLPPEEATVVTRAFSGRRARALANGFARAHPHAPAAYPEVNNLTRPMRAAASARGDTEAMSLYAGVGFRHALARPAGEIVEHLVSGLTR